MKLLTAIFAFTLFANLAFCADGQPAANPVKIAVLGDVGKYRVEMDALSVKLSAIPGVSVLERTDIEKILKEQQIALSDISMNSIRIGELLGADGVLLFENVVVKGKNYLAARLVAVRPGVILDALVIPQDLKSEEAFKIPEIMSSHFSPLFSKLSISKEDAMPVSLLSFRFSCISAGSQAILEKELNSVVKHRLMMEKKIFVNERWNLGEVEFEKVVSKDESPFWTGAYIVEGTIDAARGDTVTISLNVKKPDGTVEKTVVSGKADDLSGLSDSVMSAIMKNLKLDGASAAFEHPKEAEEYLKEAEWACRNGLYDLALSAADSAWALGNHSTELALLRIRSSGGKYFSVNTISERQYEPRSVRFDKSEPEHRIDSMLYALSIYNSLLEKSPEEMLNHQFLGISLLRHASLILISSHERSLQDDIVWKDKVSMLRQLTRTCFERYVSRPEKGDYSNCQQYAYYIFFSAGGFWMDNSSELIETYRRFFSDKPSELYSFRKPYEIRDCLNDRYKKIPMIVNWGDADSAKENICRWHEYIHLLVDSGKDTDILDGFLLLSVDDDARASFALPPGKITDFIWKHRDDILSRDRKYSFVCDRCIELMGNPDDGKTMSSYIDFCSRLLAYFREASRSRKDFDLEFVAHLIGKIFDKSHYIDDSCPTWPPPVTNRNYQDIPEDRLEALSSEFNKILAENPDLLDEQNFLNGTNYCIRETLRKLKRNRIADSSGGKDIQASDESAAAQAIPENRGPSIMFPLAPDGKYALENYPSPEEKGDFYMLSQSVIDNSLVILMEKYGARSASGFILVFREGMSTPEIIRSPSRIDGVDIPKFSTTYILSSAVPEKSLFLLRHDGKIIYYSYKDKSWHFFDDLGTCIYAGACSADGKLFVAFGEDIGKMQTAMRAAKSEEEKEQVRGQFDKSSGIFDIDMRDKSRKLLASNRRKPATTPLDDCKRYDVLSMSFCQKETLCISVLDETGKGQYCTYSPGENAWNIKDSTGKLINGGTVIFSIGSHLDIMAFPDYCGGKKTCLLPIQEMFRQNIYSKKYFLDERNATFDSTNGNCLTFSGGQLSRCGFIVCYGKESEQRKVAPVAMYSADDSNACLGEDIQVTENWIWLLGRDNGNPALWFISKRKFSEYLNGKLFNPEIKPLLSDADRESSWSDKAVFSEKCEVRIVSKNKDDEIRFTLDGTDPDKSSGRYERPFDVGTDSTVKARAFKEGSTPSDIVFFTLHKKLPNEK